MDFIGCSNHFKDIAFQGNILLFYIRGEISNEKLGKLLSDEQNAIFTDICKKVNDFIQFTIKATDKTAYKPFSDMLLIISNDLSTQVDKLHEIGGALKYMKIAI